MAVFDPIDFALGAIFFAIIGGGILRADHRHAEEIGHILEIICIISIALMAIAVLSETTDAPAGRKRIALETVPVYARTVFASDIGH